MTFASNNFDAYTGGDVLQSVGPFVNITGYTENVIVTGAKRVRANAAANAAVRHTTAPPGANYEVRADLYIHTTVGDLNAGVIGRADSAAATFYLARWRSDSGFQLYRFNSGTATQLGSTVAQSYANGATAPIKLRMNGAVIEVFKDNEDTPIISVTDGSPLGSAGFAGIYTNNSVADGGPHVDNWVAAEIDTTAPTLTSPTGTAATATTASGTVSTNEANGLLYRLATTNATETAPTVKAAALTQAVTATGSQAVAFTGLTPNTTYYAHYVHRDAAGNDSARVSSASFTTPSSGDTTPPTLNGSITIGAVTGTSIQFSWPTGADNVAVTSYEVSNNGGANYTNTGNTSTTYTFTGLVPGTSYDLRVRARDAAGNVSTPALAATQSTTAPATVTLTTEPFENWFGNVLPNLTIENVVLLRRSDRAVIAQLANQVTDVAGRLVITNNGMSTGVPVMLATWNADGSVRGIKTYTPA